MKNPILLQFVVLFLFMTLTCEISANEIKKGIGLAESRGLGAEELKALRVGWYYNWGPTSEIKTNIPFIPMAFRISTIKKLPEKSSVVLGFNEPDNVKQSNISVQDALVAWSLLSSKADFVGAPATAKNPLKKDSWLMNFMQAKPKLSFITFHWYKGVEADKFIEDLKNLCQTFQRPVWVTEFAPQTASDARQNPNRYSQAKVETFIIEATKWMENNDCIKRYAWHDSKVGTSSLFNGKELSATGKVYAKLMQESK